jgi:hypothetical protein
MCSARATVLVLLLLASACGPGGGTGLFREYEYEEDVTLATDGSAIVIVNASVPALVALRGLDLDTRPRARLDRAKIREAYESSVTRVTRVSRPWRRHGRRFVQIRVQVDDIRRLGDAAPFAWSDYRLDEDTGALVFRQVVAAGFGRDVGHVGWTGRELVAFRLHLPSRIHHHNAPSGTVERGNILSWEQPLAERRAGVPILIEARMDTASILHRTLLLFAMAFGTAIAALGGIVWWVARRREDDEAAGDAAAPIARARSVEPGSASEKG